MKLYRLDETYFFARTKARAVWLFTKHYGQKPKKVTRIKTHREGYLDGPTLATDALTFATAANRARCVAIKMYRDAGYTYAQIGAKLGISTTLAFNLNLTNP